MKKNWRQLAERSDDHRSEVRITEHYLLERQLAQQLKSADEVHRRHLYGDLYRELYTRLPDHPLQGRQPGGSEVIRRQVERLRQLVPAGSRFAEIGAGDARVSLGLCDHCSSVHALDVTEVMLAPGERPSNFCFVRFGGMEVPLADDSIDFVYSNQVLEHLHPDDAAVHLREIARILKPGGQYYCITPSKYTGPHDISYYFDNEPTGFHLKEYDYRSLGHECELAGLTPRKAYVAGRFISFSVMSWLERLLGLIPRSVIFRYAHTRIISSLYGVNLIVSKLFE